MWQDLFVCRYPFIPRIDSILERYFIGRESLGVSENFMAFLNDYYDMGITIPVFSPVSDNISAIPAYRELEGGEIEEGWFAVFSGPLGRVIPEYDRYLFKHRLSLLDKTRKEIYVGVKTEIAYILKR